MKKSTKNVRSKVAWYDEMTFISEIIASLYSYMATQKRDTLELAFTRLGSRYGFKFVPISSRRT